MRHAAAFFLFKSFECTPMFLFQMYAEQKRAGGDEDSMHMGVRIRAIHDFLSIHLGVEPAQGLQKTESNLSSAEKAFKEKGVSQFMETLTPGAQNAIYAASFVWGYENAVKYLKNAMAVEEVKNAESPVEKSHAVVENITAQAQDHSEKFAETSKFVWSFYNEDLKETQAQVAKSETITEKSSHKGAEQQVISPLAVPMSSQEAVAASLSQGSHNPSVLYCTSVEQAAEDSQEARIVVAKREQLSHLMDARQEEAKIVPADKIKSASGKQADEKLDEEVKIALQRRGEVVEEYEKAEKELKKAIDMLDDLSKDDKQAFQKATSALSPDLAKLIRARAPDLAKRKALRAQLVKWVAFCREGKDSLSKTPASRLLKLVSLSSLLKFGR
jgi:hypothetical protein